MSKKFLLPVFTFILLLFSSFIVVEPRSVHVIFNQGEIMLKVQDTKSDSAMLTPDWNVKSLTDLFGSFDRTVSSVSLYDNIGLGVWKNGDDHVSELHVNLYIDKSDPEDNGDNVSKNAFTGSFVVDGYKVTADVTPDDLKKQLISKGWILQNCSLSHNYKLTKKGIFIYFQYNPGENKLESAIMGIRHF